MANLERHILLSRYEILEIAGHGGMADVYRALDRKRSQEVAIKVLHEDLAEDPELRQRFRDEAIILSSLNHKNIVRLYEFEEEGELAFLVMDFVNGTTLKRYLRDNRMSLGQALEVLEQVCPALNYAHEEGYVHRDIKSGNIMIQNDGKVLLSDFGIAKLVEEEATGSTSLIGTAGYMSPEQILGRPLDKATDIYSLGIVAFEMTTGRRPFVGDTDQTTGGNSERVRWQQIHDAAPLPSAFNPNLPTEINQAILKALAKEPQKRPPTALEFLKEFKVGCSAIGVDAEKVIVKDEPTTQEIGHDEQQVIPDAASTKEGSLQRKRRVVTALTILALTFAGLIILVAILSAIPVAPKTIGATPTSVAQNRPGLAQPTSVPVVMSSLISETATTVPTNSPIPTPKPTTTPNTVNAKIIGLANLRSAPSIGDNIISVLAANHPVSANCLNNSKGDWVYVTTNQDGGLYMGWISSFLIDDSDDPNVSTKLRQLPVCTVISPIPTAISTITPTLTPTLPSTPTAAPTFAPTPLPSPTRGLFGIALVSPTQNMRFNAQDEWIVLEWKPNPSSFVILANNEWYRVQVFTDQVICNIYTKETMYTLPPSGQAGEGCDPQKWQFNANQITNWRVSLVVRVDNDRNHDIEKSNSQGWSFRWNK